MVKNLLQFAIIILFFYTAFIFAFPWVKYQIYKNSATKIVRTSDRIDNQKLLKMLLTEAGDLGVPVTEKNIIIDLQGSKKIVTIEYSANVKPFYLNSPVEYKFKIEEYSR